MELINVPASFPLYWGQNAGGSYIRNIPVNSQVGITNGAASLSDGFPPDTFQPAGAGGVPPFGQDFNGILRQLSQWAQWLNAGAPVVYDSTFSSGAGGYPAGALLRAATLPVNWVSMVDGNASNPDSGGANWMAQGGGAVTIASASTVDLSTTWAYLVNVTGTTTITALGTLPAGVTKVMVFGGVLTLTYNATSLLLPGAANITTAAGDVAIVQSLGSGNWKCIAYQTASGQALVPASAGSITNSQLANMPASTIKGNNGDSSASPADLTGAQATVLLSTMVGDTGSGGTKGLVPAPGTGTGAAQEYLGADAAWHPAPVGVGQTWTDESGSRALGTSYQNTTDRPIQVHVAVSVGSSSSAAFEVSSDNSSWIQLGVTSSAAGGTNSAVVGSAIVPKNWYYRARNTSGTVSIASWGELR